MSKSFKKIGRCEVNRIIFKIKNKDFCKYLENVEGAHTRIEKEEIRDLWDKLAELSGQYDVWMW